MQSRQSLHWAGSVNVYGPGVIQAASKILLVSITGGSLGKFPGRVTVISCCFDIDH
jgi:hypothetical protein